MKNASLLFALCALFSLSAFAQSTTTVEKNAKRITITTKKTDENGKTTIETYITEGENPAQILKEMAINPETIQTMDVTTDVPSQSAERLFMIRSAGDNVRIEGLLGDAEDVTIVSDNVEISEVKGNEEKEIEKIIIINRSTGNDSKATCEVKKAYFTTQGNSKGHAMVYVNGHERKSNCAALGVQVHNAGDSKGSLISSLIEKGGAQEAGLLAGDVVTKIDEFEVNDFATLHLALSHFQPGDEVTVRYNRGEKSQKTRVQLKDWAELPGHEWRSRTDCGEPETVKDIVIDNQDPVEIREIKPLQLENLRMFPNPTDGAFALSFSLEPGPLTVAITDINGKVVYSENNENASGTYTRDIDLKSVPQGNYVLSVTQGEKIYTDQISKQ
ncbi:MAG: PDZ domain-containing protein [Saprospiraceae bacterium]